MSHQKMYSLIKILSVIGVILAGYLLFQQITNSPFRPCNINSFVNCNAVITGEVAKTLGVSTSLYGLIGYVVIFFAAQTKKNKLLLGTVAFGLLFCFRLAYIELFQLRVICPICIACQMIMASIFIMALIVNRASNSSNS